MIGADQDAIRQGGRARIIGDFAVGWVIGFSGSGAPDDPVSAALTYRGLTFVLPVALLESVPDVGGAS